jgi:hypothetical protein
VVFKTRKDHQLPPEAPPYTYRQEMLDSVKCIERDAAEVKQSRSIPLQTKHTAKDMDSPATAIISHF